MDSKEDTRFMPLVAISLLTGTVAFVLGGFAFRLAAFGVVLLGLTGSYLFLWLTDDEPEPETDKPADAGPVIATPPVPGTGNVPDAPAQSAPARPGSRRGTSHQGGTGR